MKQFKRYLSVLLFCLSLSIGFSSIARADETILEDYQVEITNTYKRGSEQLEGSSITINPYNGTQEKTSTYGQSFIQEGTPGSVTTRWIFSNGKQIMKKDKEYTIDINNCYYNIGLDRTNGYNSVYLNPMEVKCLLYYSNNTTEYVDIEYNYSNRIINFSFTHKPLEDVLSFEIIIKTSFTASSFGWRYFDNVGEFISDKSFGVVIESQSEESGLLGGIIEWVKNIFNKIGEMGETLKNLPTMIWNVISEGIKSLFVPSDEYLKQYKESMTDLLNNKFGAVFQCVIIFEHLWERIQINDETNTIDFPEVTIPLPDNNEFTFGGQQVKIVPDGFDWLANSLKMLVGIVCTILFVNGLKKRYDEIMGGR